MICIPLGITKSSNGSNEYPFVALQTLSRKGKDGYILRLSAKTTSRIVETARSKIYKKITLHDHVQVVHILNVFVT